MDEKGDLVAVSHSILARWRNHLFWLLNVHGVKDFRQTELRAPEQLVLSSVLLSVRWLLKSLKGTNYQVLTKLQQN